MKAKLIDGQLVIFQQPTNILGNADAYAAEHEFKPVRYAQGPGGTYETETEIVIETPPPEPVPEWLFPDRPFRFSVPLALLFSGQPIWASFAIYADKKGIPYEELPGDLLRYYATEVYPDHQQLLASAGITIESKP